MSWRIPETDLERVKRQTDLVALVRSRGIELARHGTKDFIGLCPFHGDKHHPNFIVTPEKGLWHCMACGKAGNAIQFVQQHDGVSFRHAYELLNQDGTVALAEPEHPHSAAPRLFCPLTVAADDATLFGQVAGYYHERLKSLGPDTTARDYLAWRGLDFNPLIEHFQIGYADRTLGLRLPRMAMQEGQQLRSRLMQLGVWRETGHEHFNGCVVVPLHDAGGRVVSFYGRRARRQAVGRNDIKHLYPPGPHRGLFNRKCFNQPEIILCEAVFDALTFWVNGFRNVTCLFGTEGFTEELWEAMRGVQRVRIAYDADEAGDRAAQRDAKRFQAHGIEVWRIRFPRGLDANDYARKLKPADKSLALLMNAAEWLGAGARPPAIAPPKPPDPLPIVKPVELAPHAASPGEATAPASSLSLAASVSRPQPDAAKKEEPAASALPAPTVAVASLPTPALEQRQDTWFLDLEGREYRVGGLEKTLGTDALKIALRLRHGESFHLDQLDLCRDIERRRFIERAAEETGLTADCLKRDLGKVLLAVEQTQLELAKPVERRAAAVMLSPEERDEALKWLRAPNLIGRLREAFHKAGIIGEETNTLVAYLAGVSRKLERPLAIIIQSASAAGKTTLMDAVLNFFPEEERVKYSAMTGQSLYYLGETSLKNKILAVVEEAGAEKASYALKLLQSEGELTIASTGKDPQTGKMVTQEYHVEGPVMIFLTTTAIDLDEELQNRCLTLAVDESAEQTRRIHQLQRQRRTLAGLMAKGERKDTLKKLRNAQRLLLPLEVLNPFAPALTFATARTRNRRDHEKYLTLIDAIALLHQHQRPTHALPNGQRYIEVTLDDIALANQLVPEVLGRSLDELPPQTRRLLGYIRELVKKKSGSGQRSAKANADLSTFSRRELRDLCGWSLTQVRVHLERLVELEYLAIRHGRLGSPFVYELLLEADAPEALAHIGLIALEKLRDYKTNLAGLTAGVAGQNGQVAGGGKKLPPPQNATPALIKPSPDGLTETRIRSAAAHRKTAL
jgi:DNA primase catalytic core